MVRSFYFKGKGIIRNLKEIFVSFPFWLITFLGNFFIIIVSSIFYFLEGPPAIQFGGTMYIHSFADAVWWGFVTVTSVGYGDIVPHTLLGRILGIFLMIFGAGLFASYTGLFAKAFLEYEIGPMEEEIKELEKEIHVVTDFVKEQGVPGGAPSIFEARKFSSQGQFRAATK